jgi:hypothetical protein
MSSTDPQPLFTDEDIISRYTRGDGLRDGELVAVPEDLARQAGITIPVAMTRVAWDRYIEPDYLDQMPDQNMTSRLWDLLWMFRLAAAKSRNKSSLLFRVAFQLMHERTGTARMILKRSGETVTLKALCGPGDEGEPVITIMLPDED